MVGEPQRQVYIVHQLVDSVVLRDIHIPVVRHHVRDVLADDRPDGHQPSDSAFLQPALCLSPQSFVKPEAVADHHDPAKFTGERIELVNPFQRD